MATEKESKIKKMLFCVSPSGIVMKVFAMDEEGNQWRGGFSHPEDQIASFLGPYLTEHPAHIGGTTHQIHYYSGKATEQAIQNIETNYLGFHDEMRGLLKRMAADGELLQLTTPNAEFAHMPNWKNHHAGTEVVSLVGGDGESTQDLVGDRERTQGLTPEQAQDLLDGSEMAFREALNLPSPLLQGPVVKLREKIAIKDFGHQGTVDPDDKGPKL